MKTKRETKQSETKTGYIRPTAEVMTVRVERGFAGSGENPSPSTNPMGASTQSMGNTLWS